MKKVLLGTIMLVIGLLTFGTVWAEEKIPNLQGTWESQLLKTHQHSAEKGFKAPYERFLIIVEGQQGRAFFGHKEKIINKKVVDNEKFSGVVYWDDKTIYLVDHEKGYNFGTIESPTEIRGVYMEEGSKAMIVLLIWKKIK
jgi:hypothetical protein